MLRFIPPQIIESGSEAVSKFTSWQVCAFMGIFLSFFVFLFLACFLPEKLKKLKKINPSFLSLKVALLLFAITVLMFMTFTVSNENKFDWLHEVLFFSILPVFFASVVFLGYCLLVFVHYFFTFYKSPRMDKTSWTWVASGAFTLTCSSLALAYLFPWT